MAQFSREYQVEIDLSLQTDSVVLTTIPAHCIVEYCAMIVDTTVADANVFTVRMRNSQQALLTYNFVGEADIIGSTHAAQSDEATGAAEETVVLQYTALGGGTVTGRVRVYVRYVELF